MAEKQKQFRAINKTLGKTPNIGPIPADQLFPWSIAVFIALVLHQTFELSWIWTILVAAWGISSWWILTANGSWRILSKFVKPPNWVRIRVTYNPILQNKKKNHRK